MSLPTIAKDNANPVVHSVTKTSRFALVSPLNKQWSNISATSSPQDRSVYLALQDIDRITKGKNTALLKKMGLELSTTASQELPPPAFVPISNTRTVIVNNLATVSATTTPLSSPTGNSNNSRSSQIADVSTAEVYDIVRNIQDPEHPLTLEQLGVVSMSQIDISNTKHHAVTVRFTPTVPHCSMATQIGLCLLVKLQRAIPQHHVTVSIEPGTHASENAINKQLADKERVCAALENQHLLSVVNRCIKNGMSQ